MRPSASKLLTRQDVTQRLLRCLRLLSAIQRAQPSGRISPAELIRRLECSPATFYRELELLQNDGFLCREGRGVYRLTIQGANLARLDPSTTEVLTLAFLQASFPETLVPLQQLFQGIMDRIIHPLPPALQELFADALRGVQPAVLGRDYSRVPWTVLLEACSRCRQIEMDYESKTSGRGWRLLNPYRLTFEGNVWMLHGWCPRNQEIRSFALDNLHDARLTGHVFVWDEDAWEAFQGKEGVFLGLRGGEPVAVEVWFAPEVASYALKPGRWPRGLTAKALPDGSVRLTGTAQGTDGILVELLRWRRFARVEGGPELFAAIQEELAVMQANYISDGRSH